MRSPILLESTEENRDGLVEAIHSARKGQIIDKKEDLSLKSGFERTLEVEESTILQIYVPLSAV